jgi:hypothetical protein
MALDDCIRLGCVDDVRCGPVSLTVGGRGISRPGASRTWVRPSRPVSASGGAAGRGGASVRWENDGWNDTSGYPAGAKNAVVGGGE